MKGLRSHALRQPMHATRVDVELSRGPPGMANVTILEQIQGCWG